MNDVTVYSRPRCQACEATKSELRRLGVAFDVVDVSTDPVAAIDLVEAGFRTMPVVRVLYGTGEADVWSGHKPERLAELAQ